MGTADRKSISLQGHTSQIYFPGKDLILMGRHPWQRVTAKNMIVFSLIPTISIFGMIQDGLRVSPRGESGFFWRDCGF
jgi:hypothetical protein